MPYREKRIYSGAMLEIERVHCTQHGRLPARRGRGNPTGQAQERINLKNSRLRLMRLMCTNFTRGDYHITLTFDRLLPNAEQGRALAQFLRRLRRLCRKRAGTELRYICVREDRRVRTHYHLVCGAFGLDVQELQGMWGHGRVEVGTLDGNPDYGWMARYLTKQEEGAKGRKRWSQSKNLTEPVCPKPKILKRKALASRPQVPKEYYVMSAYRQATGQGYEWEYIVAIRYDRLQKLPEEVAEQLQRSRTWAEFCGAEDE